MGSLAIRTGAGAAEAGAAEAGAAAGAGAVTVAFIVDILIYLPMYYLNQFLFM
jgi:hypothetical protein